MTQCSLRIFKGIVGACLLISPIEAEIHPNALFSDNAVFQQGVDIPVWGSGGEGEKVSVTLDGDTESAVTKDGKWMVRLKPHKVGGPFTMRIVGTNTVTAKNVLVGEVWVCAGQSNMAFSFAGSTTANTERPLANYPNLRFFVMPHRLAIEPQTDEKAMWVECSPETVNTFSAVGYYFSRDILKKTGMPVGIIQSTVGGTAAELWTSLSGLQKEPSLSGYVETINQIKAKARSAAPDNYDADLADYEARLKAWNDTVGKEFGEAIKTWNSENANKPPGQQAPRPKPSRPKPKPPQDPVGKKPTALFNGMISPLIPYAIRGTIWYQGESNNMKPFEYRTLFPTLIADWREKWGEGDFPFFYVQIAPFRGDCPELREAQFLTLRKTKNTAMAVTVDVGDAVNLHPHQKEPIGDRLALAARALVYGEKIEYSGPLYDSFESDGNKIILSFTHVGAGLVAKDGPLKGFKIAGADKKFVDAKADIKGANVIVSSDQVPRPVAVRYGFENLPDGNLWNKDGLPASTFRTDPDSLTGDAQMSKMASKEVPATNATQESGAQ